MSDPAGYSGTPLAQKLGLKDGQRALFIDLPASLAELAASRRFVESSCITVAQLGNAVPGYHFIHLVTAARSVLESLAQPLMNLIARDGMIWVSWPKKAAKVATDITEDVIRDVVLPIGLVDVKVCAVDETWSGLKLVIRKELR
ncbi:DUF3052 domain-containing protein [Devosia oryziradicis]|uniref:DUF3052 domain-containing protein n=1 Tax=Devosia oryziradicis TaxID=2801335 RepID=A0ABX7BYW7_9HYPH|nr:DUF3052 domain-containing protein [Devosia oryziradicis]QQR36703.1 DUF3052 domain-containing protein [Devosia oryziradicis]